MNNPRDVLGFSNTSNDRIIKSEAKPPLIKIIDEQDSPDGLRTRVIYEFNIITKEEVKEIEYYELNDKPELKKKTLPEFSYFKYQNMLEIESGAKECVPAILKLIYKHLEPKLKEKFRSATLHTIQEIYEID